MGCWWALSWVFVVCLIVVFRLWRVCCCAIEFGVFVFAVGGACLFVLWCWRFTVDSVGYIVSFVVFCLDCLLKVIIVGVLRLVCRLCACLVFGYYTLLGFRLCWCLVVWVWFTAY